MRNAIVGAMAGLIFGAACALGYSHYLGEGKQLADAQDQLSKATANLTKATEDTKAAKQETESMTAQIQQLSSTNEKLKQQVEIAAQAPTLAAAPANPFANMGGAMKEYMARQSESKFQLLVSKLHLSVDQQAALKAAMDDENKRNQEMTGKMFSGGKIDPQAMADLKSHKTVDETMNEILNPEQKTQYKQIETDEKNSAAETVASVEMNQFAPALQLSDSQKDQVYTALTQVQLQASDPDWIKNNMTPGNTAGFLDAQAKAKEDALAKILSPDQLATYRQQAQSMLDMQKAMIQKFTPASAAAAPANNAAPANSAPSSGP
jgi:chromosome segregation ATPase